MDRPCRGNLRRLRALLHGALRPRSADRLRSHLASCSGCRETFERLERVQRVCRDLGNRPLPEVNFRQVETQVHWRLAQPPERAQLRIGWRPALATLGATVLVGAVAGALLSWGLAPDRPPRVVERVVPAPPLPVSEREIGALATLISGEVLVQSANADPVPLTIERPLLQGDRLITRQGEVALQWGRRSGLRLPGDSALVLRRLTDQTQSMVLEAGRVMLEVRRTGEQRVSVEAGPILARVKGTRFAVSLDEHQAEVVVRRGRVAVSPLRDRWPRVERPADPPLQPAADGSVPVDAGHRLVVPIDGVPLLGPLDDDDGLDAALNLQPWISLHRLLVSSATLAVSSTPPADLFLDRVELGRTRIALRGSAGRHLIELYRDGKLLRRQWIDLEMTGAQSLTLDLSRQTSKPNPKLSAGIYATFRRRAPLLRACYERQLKRDPTLSGRLVLKLAIDGEGGLSQASIQHDSLAEPQVGQCVLASVRSWRFPPDNPVEIVYPLVFRPE